MIIFIKKMKLIKKIFGIKTTYAIPSDNGVDITKGKKYVYKEFEKGIGFIKDNSNLRITIRENKCYHIKNGNWQIITE